MIKPLLIVGFFAIVASGQNYYKILGGSYEPLNRLPGLREMAENPRQTPAAPGVLDFITSSVTVPEAGGTVTLTVGRFGGADGAVTVDYVLSNEIATGGTSCAPGVDYINTGGSLSFSEGQTSRSFNVAICDDQADEFNERFNVTLTNPTGGATVGNASTAVVGIIDDDAEPSVSISDVTQIEGSSATGITAFVFTVSLSAPAGRWSTINYDTANGSASAGSDYAAITGPMLIFDVGEQFKQFTVQVTPDYRVEENETFFVNLRTPTFMVIADGQGTGTIINDDIGGNVQFGGVAYNVNENQAAAVVTVTRENGNASDIVVQYSSSNGSATANQDYLPVNGSVTFGANETVKTFTVPIINDSLDEEPIENVHLTLTGVAGGATLGAPSNAVLNIEDDDPPPQLRLNNLSLNEGSSGQMSFASVTVNLLAASGRSVSVNFSTENGTAAAPADYQAVSGTLTFSPGETSKTLSVGIVGDRDIEPDEFFRILLASPVNATIENGIGTVTILNDDFRRAAHDFDGDGRADISVYRPSDGTWYLLRSSGGFAAQQFGISTDKPVPADYDGDGRTDIAVFRGGVWYLLRSSAGFTGVQFGTSEDIPQPADFDGDGRAELAVFRPSTGTWYMLNLATNQFSGIQFGAGGDKPVAADYDGDGRADQAVFRPSDGTWYLLRSTQGFTGVQFGISTDRPVPADYDADGKVDQAVYRDGIWYILGSSQGFTGIQFGIASDIPAPADFDGDGKADPAVFRNGNWYLLQTTDGFNGVQFGTNGDAPLSPAFIP